MSADATPAPETPPASRPRGRWTFRREAARGRSRHVRRLAVSGMLLGLVGLFAWLLFSPFYHPRTHHFFLTGGDYKVLVAPPVTFVSEDYTALKALSGVIAKEDGKPGPRILSNLRNPVAMESLAEKLEGEDANGDDVLIVSLSGHGISEDGVAYLVCRNFDPTSASLGRYEVRHLVDQLASCSAKTKLLILDAGRIECDPRLGLLVNEFPRLLASAVEEVGDPSLWVLSANSTLERSHVSPSLERSVFGYYVTRGLQGAADRNGNRSIDVDELYRYVSTGVADWAEQTSGGLAVQTPVLHWGGGNDLRRAASPTLLPSSGLRDEANTLSRDVDTAQRKSRTAPLRRVKENDVVGRAARRTESRVENRLESAAGGVVPRAREAHAQAGELGLLPPRTGDGEEAGGDAENEKSPPAGEQAAAKPGAANKPAAASEKPAEATAANPDSELKAVAAEGPSSDAASKPAADTKTGATAANAAAPASGTASKSSKPEQVVAELLDRGWRIRDLLDGSAPVHDRPRECAPQVWREFEDWLVGQEALYRAGNISDLAEIVAALRPEIEALEKLPNPPEDDRKKGPRFAMRIAALYSLDPEGTSDPRSLALAEELDSPGVEIMTPELRAAAAALRNFIYSGERSGFDKWIAELPIEYDRFSEFRLARRLDALHRIDWPTIQLALEARADGERQAADRVTRPWMAARIETIDALRISGERKLLDRIGRDRQEQAVRLLREALYQYREVAADRQAVAAAMNLAHQLLQRAPYLVAWHNAAGFYGDALASKHEPLAQLFFQLATLERLLEAGRPENLAEIKKQAAALAALRDQVETGLQAAAIDALTGMPAAPGDTCRIENLLLTPLPTAAARAQLLGSVVSLDSDLTAEVHGAKADEAPKPKTAMTRDAWRRLEERADLALALVRLADPQGAGSGQASERVRRQHAALVAVRLADQAARSGDFDDTNLWQAHRGFGQAVAQFWRELPSAIESSIKRERDLQTVATRNKRLAGLRAAERSLRLVDGRDVAHLESLNPGQLVRQAELYDQLLWQRRRSVLARSDAPPHDAMYLADTATSYLNQANTIPRQPKAAVEATPQLEIDGPRTLDLAVRSQGDLPVSVVLRGLDQADTWIVLDNDPELVEVLAGRELNIYHDPPARGSNQAKPENQPAGRPDVLALPPTLKLRAGIAETLRLRVQGRTSSPMPATLIVKAITRGAAVRHEIDVTLPTPDSVDLVVAGTPGTWSPTEDGAMLNVFPNQGTRYELGLANRGPNERVVDVELLAIVEPRSVALPPASLSVTEADAVLAKFGPLVSLASLPKTAVPPGGTARLAFPPPPAPPKLAPGEASPPRTSVQLGLLLAITDQDTHQKSIKRLSIAPQRPRRYVRPRVGYNLEREQLQIRVVPQDRSLLPPAGAKVLCEIVEPLGAGTEKQLDGEVTAPAFESNLFVGVPSDDRRVLTVRLHVDGYPRAFVYHVPCGVQSNDLPEELDLREVRVLSPLAGKVFKAPLGVIPVEFEVDSPAHGFQPMPGLVEIGVDADRDRDLRDETTIELAYDRQVSAVLDRLAPGGVLVIDTSIRDFKLDLPAPNTIGSKADLLARVTAAGRSAWSMPTQVILDGMAPRIVRVELKPAGVVTLGGDLEVKILATDDELSGVERVEAAFDLLGTGKFEGAMPMPATQNDDGHWIAKLKTAPLATGVNKVIVRAFDRAGNESKTASVRFRAITAEEVATSVDSRNGLAGAVVFGGAPAPKVEVSIEVAEGDEIAPVVTNEQGTFNFGKVPPGKYRISAKGLIHNKVRRQSVDVEVEAPPARSPAVKILLR